MAVSQGIHMQCGERLEAMDTRNLNKKRSAHETRCKQCKDTK